MKEKILAVVSQLQAEREAAHIVPSHVLASEIINHGCPNPYQAINELCREGKLHWHRTLNGYAFTISRHQV